MPVPLGVNTMLLLAVVLIIVVPLIFKLPIVVLLGKLVTPTRPIYLYPTMYNTLPEVNGAGIVSPIKFNTPD